MILNIIKNKFVQLRFYLNRLQSKKLFSLAGLFIILAAIPLTVIFSQFQQKFQQNASNQTDQSSPIIITDTPQNSKLKIDSNKLDKTYTKLLNRKQKSISESTALDNVKSVIKKSNSPDGIVFSSPEVIVEYFGGFDNYSATILTVDISLAKTKTENWLRDQGLTNQEICDLQLTYDLSPDIENLLPTETTFDPNPLSCDQASPTPPASTISSPIKIVIPTTAPVK